MEYKVKVVNTALNTEEYVNGDEVMTKDTAEVLVESLSTILSKGYEVSLVEVNVAPE